MVRINGTDYPTVSDAAKEFAVAVKTVLDWIDKHIIDQPPQIDHGARTMNYFPPEYMEKAHKDLRRHRDSKRKGQMALFSVNKAKG